MSGSRNARYSYDESGNRVQATRGTTTTRYIYDASGNLLAEANDANVIQRYYIYGTGLLAMATPAGDLFAYHFDSTGNTIAMTDINKQIVNSYAYTPFGIIGNRSETIVQPFTYVGRHGVMTEPDGWYYMRARYYDPVAGRFISEDPLGFDGGDVNLYAYAANNPVMLIDPTGLIWETIDHDYHGVHNWGRGFLNWFSNKIGSGWNPGIPGSDSSDYEGTKRDLVQIWLHDVDNPSRDSEYAIGTKRIIPQTYTKKPIPKPNELWDSTTTHYWKPSVSSKTYDDYPGSTIQSPGKRKY